MTGEHLISTHLADNISIMNTWRLLMSQAALPLVTLLQCKRTEAPDLVGNRGVIAGPEAAAEELHAHDGKDEEEEPHHNGYVGHGSQGQRD